MSRWLAWGDKCQALASRAQRGATAPLGTGGSLSLQSILTCWILFHGRIQSGSQRQPMAAGVRRRAAPPQLATRHAALPRVETDDSCWSA